MESSACASTVFASDKIWTPVEFETLSATTQQQAFELLKTKADCKPVTTLHKCSYWDSELKEMVRVTKPVEVVKDYIHRPIRINELPQGWDMYIPYLNKSYPEGEKFLFNNKTVDTDNYKMLYTWVNQGCMHCHAPKSSLHWEEGDKHIEYYCYTCGDETPFVKHWRAYY